MSNVSFGGNWSEELVEAEYVRDLLLNLEWAVENCTQRDIRTEAVQATLLYVTSHADKGPMLVDRWERGHKIEYPFLREKHFIDTLKLIMDNLGISHGSSKSSDASADHFTSNDDIKSAVKSEQNRASSQKENIFKARGKKSIGKNSIEKNSMHTLGFL